MKERRKSERINTHLLAKWETAAGRFQGTVINSSAGGCFVRAQIDEPGDEPIQLSVQLPDGKQVQLWGEVAYYLPLEGFGLHFSCSSDEDPMMLSTWLDYLRTSDCQVNELLSQFGHPRPGVNGVGMA